MAEKVRVIKCVQFGKILKFSFENIFVLEET